MHAKALTREPRRVDSTVHTSATMGAKLTVVTDCVTPVVEAVFRHEMRHVLSVRQSATGGRKSGIPTARDCRGIVFGASGN
jgi:hypothetical protein